MTKSRDTADINSGTNTAVGEDALENNTASNNTAVGYRAGLSNTTGDFNTFVGRQSGDAVTTGAQNTFLGSDAGSSTTTSNYNTAVGKSSMFYNTTGASNTALGVSALQSNTTASFNTAVGYQAGYNNTGAYNTAIGDRALRTNTTGEKNTVIGHASMYYNITGSSNVALGYESLSQNTTASNNTAVGYQAGYNNTTGTRNTFIGLQSGYDNTTGTDNSVLGDNAAQNLTSGSNNVAVGRSALNNNTTASYNTAVGHQAGFSATTSGLNTFIGAKAGYSSTGNYNTFVGHGTIAGTGDFGSGQLMTTGTKNTILGGYNGNQGGLDIRTSSNRIVLSDGDGNPRVQVNSNGRLDIGNYTNWITNGDIARWWMGSGASGYFHKFIFNNNIAGSITLSGTSVAFNTSSDYRLKENVDYTWDATTRLKQLKPARFNFIADADTTVDGFLAHEVQSVVPEAVHGTHNEVNADGNPEYQGIDQSKLVPLLVKTIQELEARITALEA